MPCPDHCDHDHPTPRVSPTDAVAVEGVCKRYGSGDAPEALSNVTLGVAPGERLGVLGPNGGGKTTLLKIIQGELRPDQGTVRVLGGSPAAARRSGRLGVVSQKQTIEPAYPATVRDLVCMPLGLRGRLSKAERMKRTDEAIALVGAEAYADQPVRSLSGGQLQRALIARAVASGAELLLLDEPTVGVDAVGQERFNALLDRLQEETGVTIVLVSHQLRTIAATCDRIACLNRTLHLHGDPKGLTPEVLQEVFEHDVADVLDRPSEAPS